MSVRRVSAGAAAQASNGERSSAVPASAGLNNGNRSGRFSDAPRCGAKARAEGRPCRHPAIHGERRCRMHGGLSTGPMTPEGLARSRRARWVHGRRSREAVEARKRANWETLEQGVACILLKERLRFSTGGIGRFWTGLDNCPRVRAAPFTNAVSYGKLHAHGGRYSPIPAASGRCCPGGARTIAVGDGADSRSFPELGVGPQFRHIYWG